MPRTDKPRIVIFGASGRVGRLLTQAFHEKGHAVTGVARNAAALAALPCEPATLDFSDVRDATPVAREGDIAINAAHARFTEAVARLCAPDIARLVVIGSTRYLTKFPDRKAREVGDAARFLKESKLPWVMLHPTMIYGAQGENNVQRMATIIRRFHVVPLPNGGSALIQPVHVDDVVQAVVAAATGKEPDGRTIHLAGPAPATYKAFLEAIADAAGTWVRVVPLPLPLLHVLAVLTRLVPGVPSITGAEVKRLLEDKDVDTHDMVRLLGVTPRSLEQGLAETFKG